MTERHAHIRSPDRKSIIVLAAAVLCGVLIAGFVFLSLKDKSASGDDAALVAFSGLPESATAEIRIESPQGVEDHTISAEAPAIPNDAGLVPPYKIYVTLKLPHDRYRDFIVSVDKDGHYSATTDGFDAWDAVSLSIGKDAVFSSLPSDWSGKLQLDARLPEKGAGTACLEINSGTGTLGLCHSVGTAVTS